MDFSKWRWPLCKGQDDPQSQGVPCSYLLTLAGTRAWPLPPCPTSSPRVLWNVALGTEGRPWLSVAFWPGATLV